MSDLRKQVEADVTEILGYSCETSAPNSAPTTEFITDRWMRPRREALVDYILGKVAETLIDCVQAQIAEDNS